MASSEYTTAPAADTAWPASRPELDILAQVEQRAASLRRRRRLPATALAIVTCVAIGASLGTGAGNGAVSTGLRVAGDGAPGGRSASSSPVRDGVTSRESTADPQSPSGPDDVAGADSGTTNGRRAGDGSAVAAGTSNATGTASDAGSRGAPARPDDAGPGHIPATAKTRAERVLTDASGDADQPSGFNESEPSLDIVAARLGLEGTHLTAAFGVLDVESEPKSRGPVRSGPPSSSWYQMAFEIGGQRVVLDVDRPYKGGSASGQMTVGNSAVPVTIETDRATDEVVARVRTADLDRALASTGASEQQVTKGTTAHRITLRTGVEQGGATLTADDAGGDAVSTTFR